MYATIILQGTKNIYKCIVLLNFLLACKKLLLDRRERKMKTVALKEQKEIKGGAVWVCRTCGYISNDHIFIETAKARAYDHERKYKGHKTKVRG